MPRRSVQGTCEVRTCAAEDLGEGFVRGVELGREPDEGREGVELDGERAEGRHPALDVKQEGADREQAIGAQEAGQLGLE